MLLAEQALAKALADLLPEQLQDAASLPRLLSRTGTTDEPAQQGTIELAGGVSQTRAARSPKEVVEETDAWWNIRMGRGTQVWRAPPVGQPEGGV
jgi:hypothetical protein